MEKKNFITYIIIGFIGIVTIFMGIGFYMTNNKDGDSGKKTFFTSFMEKFDESDVSEQAKSSMSSVANPECQLAYENVLAMNDFDFSECTQSAIREGSYDDVSATEIKNNLVIIFDSSGSMAQQIDGRSKIDIAKEATKKYIDQLGGDKLLNLGIIVYGHKGGNNQSQKALSCAGIEDLYYLGPVNAHIAKTKIDQFNATGWTPIAQSLESAGKMMEKIPVNGKNIILLVSDGKETCDGKPVEMIKSLRNSGLNVTANVIGFDVGGADEQELKNIAESGGGDYFSVKNAQEFEMVFQKHENALKKAHYQIGRTVEQIYDMSSVMSQYNQCMTMLRKEEAVMMLDIHSSKLSGAKCELYADQEYWKRNANIVQKLEDNFSRDKQKFDALKGM